MPRSFKPSSTHIYALGLGLLCLFLGLIIFFASPNRHKPKPIIMSFDEFSGQIFLAHPIQKNNSTILVFPDLKKWESESKMYCYLDASNQGYLSLTVFIEGKINTKTQIASKTIPNSWPIFWTFGKLELKNKKLIIHPSRSAESAIMPIMFMTFGISLMIYALITIKKTRFV